MSMKTMRTDYFKRAKEIADSAVREAELKGMGYAYATGALTAHLANIFREKDELVEALRELIHATEGNHSLHWDSTQNYGAGCKQCILERAARARAAELIGICRATTL